MTTKQQATKPKVRVVDLVTKRTSYVRGPIGKELKEAREHLGMTQQNVVDETHAIAKKIGAKGICLSTVARAEQDDNVKGSWGTMRCRCLHANAVNLQLVLEPE